MCYFVEGRVLPRPEQDLASEEGEEQEDNTLAATIFGKEYESGSLI